MKEHMEKLAAYNADHWVGDWLIKVGVPHNLVDLTAMGIDLGILICIAILADIFTKRVVLPAIQKAVSRSQTDLDDVLFENRVFDALVHIAPALVIQAGAPIVFEDVPVVLPWISKAVSVYIIGSVVWVASAVLDALYEFSKRSEYLKDKPMLSYIQVGKLVVYILASILIFSSLFDKSPLVVLSAFGAVAAVLLFVFKDTIMGLVASIQISTNDMLRVGDCVTMEKYQADGEVTRITLNTITVQNYDKTISHIPSFVFVSDSFKNWRGMSDSGVRRIKRTLLINISTVRFCDKEMLDRFSKFELLKDYIDSRSKEIEEYNAEAGIDKVYPINGRHLTNIGVLRQYMQNYLERNPHIRQDMTCLVRQLNPTENGIPLEVYCYANTTELTPYENIQSDLFDHLMASVPLFDLTIFQRPSGTDFRHQD
jgi:miniconductance mechanosensitive channel